MTNQIFKESGSKISITKEILGEGGFSTVYRANNCYSNSRVGSGSSCQQRSYALKKVLIQDEETNRSIQTEKEKNSFNQFKHSNILQLIDSFEYMNPERRIRVVYLLFPLMRRGSLRDCLNIQL